MTAVLMFDFLREAYLLFLREAVLRMDREPIAASNYNCQIRSISSAAATAGSRVVECKDRHALGGGAGKGKGSKKRRSNCDDERCPHPHSHSHSQSIRRVSRKLDPLRSMRGYSYPGAT